MLTQFKGNPIEIGNQYQSRLSDSTGRIYEVKGFQENGDLINFKGVGMNFTATFKRKQVEDWIGEGRMILIGKNLLA